jgi:acetylornithine deacetylase/succinyl-diaminopimelate desuccinylase-like protein
MSAALGDVYDAIDDGLEDTVTSIQEYIRQPSVSVDGIGIRECAELVATRYRQLGCQHVEVVDTPGAPAVWAYFDAGAPKTIVNYDMYDVRSVGDEADWRHPPFGAVVTHGEGFPRVVYGRGACVPKGPSTAWLGSLRAIVAARGTLPVNIAFLAEGDEILGSPSYGSLIDRFRDRLEGISGCLYLRATQNLAGELPLVLGYKGLLTLEIEASGRSWGRGPVDAPAHSATKPVVDSPTWRLIHALAALMRTGTDRPAVAALEPLFVDDASALPEDEELVAELLARFGSGSWEDSLPGLAGAGVRTFADDLEGAEVLRRYLYGSTFNIQGLAAGYTGPGTRTFTIPERATALLDARLITDLAPADVVAEIRRHLTAAGYGDVEVRAKGGYPGSRTPLHASLVQSFLAALAPLGARPVIWPYQGYGGPWSLFASEFGAPVVFATGPGHGGRVGAADEFFVLDGGGKIPGLREIERFSADLLFDCAAREEA